MSLSGFPDRTDLFVWLGTPDPGTGPDDIYDHALAEAQADQQARCEIPDPYPPQLHYAGLRRTARILAARGHALGVVDMGDYAGLARISRWDSEADRYEAHYLLGGFA